MPPKKKQRNVLNEPYSSINSLEQGSTESSSLASETRNLASIGDADPRSTEPANDIRSLASVGDMEAWSVLAMGDWGGRTGPRADSRASPLAEEPHVKPEEFTIPTIGAPYDPYFRENVLLRKS